MFSTINLTKKGLILVLVPVVFEVLFVAILAYMLSAAAKQFDQLEHAQDALVAMHSVDMELGKTIVAPNESKVSNGTRLSQIARVLKLADAQLEEFGNAQQYPEFVTFLDDFQSFRTQSAQIQSSMKKALERNLDPASLFAVQKDQQPSLYFQSRALNREIVHIENKLRTAEPRQLEETFWSAVRLLVAGLIVSGILSTGLAYFFASDINKRLRLIGSNAEKLAHGDALAPVNSDATDEIAELDQALHQASRILGDVRRKELAILENAADVICSLDGKLRFRAAGAVVARVWNYTPDELLGLSLLNLLEASDKDAARAAYERIQNQGEGEIENVIVTKDGKLKNLLWKVSWSKDESSYFCVVHDVTELRSIEKLKRRFIAIVSHDLRTPLTSVGVCLTFLLSGRRGFVPDDVRKLLELAQKSTTRLMDLVNELLELEKLGAGKFLLNPICISISDVCAAAREQIQSSADRARVRITGPVGDALAFADQQRLVQVVFNLLTNAVRYSETNSTVILSIVKTEGDFVTLRVADRGPGIPPEERNSVFDKFQRTGTPSALRLPTVKTTGLGLAIVKAIIEAHGGQVGVDSNEGHGSVFWITVPKYHDDEEDDV